MVGSVINEGLRGIQASQRELQRSANEIAGANVRENPNEQVDRSTDTTLPPINEAQESTQRGIEEPLIELRRQEQLFNASAQVVSVANENLGSLIDIKS
ncbi:hypothetical protein [Agarilytica rhodophyticola]|uniref:hypothetical protein n=1 Tax=Agarilytica rhodophyticola TaxID=1737490 RepID=UPI000B343FEF|nr:hypothetical protein [Agarilytica rhodophyticola]